MLAELSKIYKSRLNQEQRDRFRRFQSQRFRGLQHIAFRTLFGSNLKALAFSYGTDKWTTHNYVDVYGPLLAPLRKKRLNLLEIGVGGYEDPLAGGGSLRMWRTYFAKSHIYAIDINDKSPHDERRITTFQGSQDDEAFLNKVADRIGRIDLIIDDGSHVCRHVITSFEVLFPRLAPGGIYVVEDTQTSYWEGFGGSVDLDHPGTTMNYFRRLIDSVNLREIQQVKPEYTPAPIERSVAAIGFFEKMIVIRKTA
jgi:hypothetical protein